MEKNKDTQDEVRVLMIEGVVVGDEVKIRYKLPPVSNKTMEEFYKAFIIQLCENIAKLEGAENLFDVMEDDNDDE
jgi:hypothetical protein